MTIGEILQKNNLTVDLVHNKAMTDRMYRSMEEYGKQQWNEAIEKMEAEIKDFSEWCSRGKWVYMNDFGTWYNTKTTGYATTSELLNQFRRKK